MDSALRAQMHCCGTNLCVLVLLSSHKHSTRKQRTQCISTVYRHSVAAAAQEYKPGEPGLDLDWQTARCLTQHTHRSQCLTQLGVRGAVSVRECWDAITYCHSSSTGGFKTTQGSSLPMSTSSMSSPCTPALLTASPMTAPPAWRHEQGEG